MKILTRDNTVLPILITIISCLSFSADTLAADITAEGYDSHVELEWPKSDVADVEYRVEIKSKDNKWILRQQGFDNRILDFVNDLGRNLTLTYRVSEVKGEETTVIGETTTTTHDFDDEELMDMVQKYTFRFFWEFADPKSGFAYERQPNTYEGKVITSGGTGFGIASIITGVERGWITREHAAKRLLKLTNSLEKFERFHGMWAHWYDAIDQQVFHFSEYDDGGDIVESAFVAQGLLTARQYFDGNSTTEKQLRTKITKLWEAMDWNWYTRGEDVLYWHWSKNHGWKMNHRIEGYNEALIVFVLAASSPTHPINTGPYHQGWAGWTVPTMRNNQTYYGMTLPLGNTKTMGGPLFFAHYSFMGLDPRGLRDEYTNYWQQNTRHTLINRAYCLDNPFGWEGYGEDLWGLTAGDVVPAGYNAHAPGPQRDNGTINPTGALSSMPYTPKESIKVLKNLYRNHGREAFGLMGFYDAINFSVSDDPTKQVRKTYLAIDQGPIVAMIENYRTALLWDTFMKDQDIKRGLRKLGFTINGKAPQ